MDARKSCHELDFAATLPTVKNQAERDFLVDLIFSKGKLSNNLWLGATYLSRKYVWLDDNSSLDGGYRNWERPEVKNVYEGRCIEMEADEGRRGKWIDEPCTKLNLLVCQKRPIWSLSFIQQTLLETRKELAQTKTELEQSKADSKAEMAQLKESILPLGFIYVQLPLEKEPSAIWPTMTWTEISSAYAGVFFRVTGGGSADFGTLQAEEFPHIDTAKYHTYLNDEGLVSLESCTFAKGRSGTILTGRFAEGTINNAIELHTTDGEVRPRNMAIKLWKRSA